MPAAYAHYVFGQKVLRELPRDLQERIKDYLPLYHIGLHGPDILFYYEPLHANEVNQLGTKMHNENADAFFERAKQLSNLTFHNGEGLFSGDRLGRGIPFQQAALCLDMRSGANMF